jgi:hypothetical protein
VTRPIYAMDLGRGMGVCGRIVRDVRFVESGRVEITWEDGVTQAHAHDLLDVDEFTPQRLERLDVAQRIIEGIYEDDGLTVLGHCPHGVDLDREFCPRGCRV